MIRITLHASEFDDLGVITDHARRRIATSLADCPAQYPVRINLGRCRHLQDLLINDLVNYAVAFMITFEAADWRIARDHTEALAHALGVTV
jgi:hypothetical protein